MERFKLFGGAHQAPCVGCKEGPQGRKGSITPPPLRERGTIVSPLGVMSMFCYIGGGGVARWGECRGRACLDGRVTWLGGGDGQPEARRSCRAGKRTGNTLERMTAILSLTLKQFCGGWQAFTVRWRVCFCRLSCVLYCTDKLQPGWSVYFCLFIIFFCF